MNGIFESGDINCSAFSRYWSDVNIINYYNNRKFKRINNDKTIKENFQKCDWNEFNTEQLVFIGNTLHLCIF